MNSTSSFIKELQNEMPEMNGVDSKIRQLALSHSTPVRELIEYVLTGSGKRVRPLLVVLSASFYLSEGDAVIEVASAAELIHLASLVHDDVVDNGEIRRGYPTLYKHSNSNVAVLIGDMLFAHALELLDKHSHFGVTRVISKAISMMCEGELEQINSTFDVEKSEKEYLEQVRKKTGALMGACCEAGGMLSEMPENEVKQLRKFGESLGCAFQIVDDIFDFIADTEELGKPVGLDIQQGIITLPLIHLFNNQTYGSFTKRFFSNKVMGPSLIKQIKGLVVKEGCIELAFAQAETIIREAQAFLEPLPNCNSKKLLMDVSEFVLARRY